MESTIKRKAPESEEKGPSLAKLRKLLKGKLEKEEENPNEETDNNKMRAGSSIGQSNDEKELAWMEKQRIPTGSSSSPAIEIRDLGYSSDEEYEGFLEPQRLVLGDASLETTEEDVISFFDGFRCGVIGKDKDTEDKTWSFVIEFRSTKSAVDALNKYKRTPLRGKYVCLTRCLITKYRSFRIEWSNKNLSQIAIKNLVHKKVAKFGTVLRFYFPSEGETVVYLYLEMKAGVLPEKVAFQNFKVTPCNMKMKLTKKLFKK